MMHQEKVPAAVKNVQGRTGTTVAEREAELLREQLDSPVEIPFVVLEPGRIQSHHGERRPAREVDENAQIAREVRPAHPNMRLASEARQNAFLQPAHVVSEQRIEQ